MDYFSKELKKVGVNRQVLWEEYKAGSPNPYSYAQFCYHIKQYQRSGKPSMILDHKPGDKLYVDYAGKLLFYIDRQTGEEIKVQVFVACLYDLIEEKTIADAILDRIIHSAIRFELKGESMRKKMKNN